MGVRVLSLFDGMACGMLAMLRGGLDVDEYFAYEIDKYAIKTVTHNFPMIKECGDVFKADFTQYEGIDYVVGGSPCTYWSIAQKNNRETEASGLGWELFSQYVRAIHEAKPKFFIYENNKSMSNAIRESISKEFGFEPICINSALVSAQNRNRLYWVGKRNPDGTYSKVNVEQPEDRGILLKDILDSGSDFTTNDKSWTLTASYNGAVPWNTIERCQRNMVAEPVNTTVGDKSHTIKAQYYKNGMANFITNGGHSATAVAEPVGVSQRGRYTESGNRSSKCEGGTSQFVEARTDGKSNCVTTVQKDYMVAVPVNPTSDGKAQCLRATYYKDGIRNIAGNNVDRKTGVAEPVGTTKDGKSYCLTAGYANGSGENIGNYAAHTLEKGCKSMAAEPVCVQEQVYGRKVQDDGSYDRRYEARNDNKSGTLTGTMRQNSLAEPVAGPIRVGALPRPNGELSTSQAMRVYDIDGKSVNICAGSGGMGGKTGLYAVPVYEFIDCKIRDNAHIAVNENAIRGVQDKNGASCAENFYEFTDRKANTLTTAHVPKIVDNIENYKMYAEPCEWDDNGTPTKAKSYADNKTYTVYEVKDGQITIKDKQYPIKLADGYYIIRKLTVSECKRLQTVPEWYVFPVSDTQAYKMIGNGWTVDVIAHLIKSTLMEDTNDT